MATEPNLGESRPLPIEHATRDFFRSAMAGLVDAVCVTTADPGCLDPRIVYVNAAFERLTGYSEAEALGRNPRFLQGPNSDRAVLDRLKADLIAGREFQGSTANYRKDGTEYHVEWRVSTVRDDRMPMNWVAVQRDVPERWLLHRAHQASLDETEDRVRRRTAELIEANDELEAFCQTVAHDLRAPIRSIVLRCRLAEEGLPQPASPETVDHLRSLGRNARRLAVLVEDLLEYTRLGKRELSRMRVDVSAMARRLREEIVPEWHGGSSSVEVEGDMVVQADLRLLEIALRNLVENACKYAGRGARIQVGRAETERGGAFFVRDDGAGFDMAHAGRLFQPFVRLHSDRKIDGTGIGLASVRRVAERHGGQVWAESKPGEGATFWLTLAPVA